VAHSLLSNNNGVLTLNL